MKHESGETNKHVGKGSPHILKGSKRVSEMGQKITHRKVLESASFPVESFFLFPSFERYLAIKLHDCLSVIPLSTFDVISSDTQRLVLDPTFLEPLELARGKVFSD
jgi:hypothetical protein